ncbi:MAG TPA: glycosyltransferase family 2 protein [Candidatus Koribacter sp.]
MSKPSDRPALPSPPVEKSGWPWISADRVSTPPGEWPRITIVTPSLNQGKYLEATIRSVLLQGYPNLEYFVMDGGSQDGSLEILQRYGPWLDYWVSEPDAGHPNAVNKGLKRATGSLLGFLNSDDFLLPGALEKIGRAHTLDREKLIAGDVIDFRDATGEQHRIGQSGLKFRTFVEVWRQDEWHQPGIFFPRTLLDKIGLFDETLHLGFDYDFFCRALQYADVAQLNEPVAMFRLHEQSKTVSNEILIVREHLQISRRYWHLIPGVDVRGYRRFAAQRMFCAGVSRLRHRRPRAARLIWEGFASHPGWALISAVRQFPGWLRRRATRS